MMSTDFFIFSAVFLTAALLSGALWYWYFYRREKKLLTRLSDMVEQAIDGSLSQREISEEKVSALENSLKRYLDEWQITGEEQKQQNLKIQELISDISHQTLTPISNLQLYSQLLKEQQKEPSPELETICEETEKLDFLIQSLVKLSRMENGIIAVRPQRTSVSELLTGIKERYIAKAEEKKITFTVSETKETAFFDGKWTEEALGNIVDNAVKYTPEGGRIQIRAEAYSFFTRIDVEDSGIGMKETELNKIFSRFYRSFDVADEPGVGIGLYLAREIIQAQKGYIKVASEKGKGSLFSVFLPR